MFFIVDKKLKPGEGDCVYDWVVYSLMEVSLIFNDFQKIANFSIIWKSITFFNIWEPSFPVVV